MVIYSYIKVKSYVSLKVSEVKFLVTRSVEKKTDSFLPKFQRVYVVVMEGNLYALSRIPVTKELEEISAILNDIKQNDSKGVYVHDSVSEIMEGSNYQYD
eukprot:5199917-Ditylum_brightwellii.AAC.1